ncbi:MAG: invasion associated locus B family protein [Yoonia sp.]|uniref:invasion associated locus B family protein n=1 Tax=Yoonia sp. TaxID=2212373 RepID=UPI00273DA2C4|nr:invasion associated locus B family protein [Yoonia sp.]MDP5084908.1 invasion associated locus B family protein [Yoonia sp.]MDP5361834.1 invasion associated locus B family protein [Paracoccaceae bacterium]
MILKISRMIGVAAAVVFAGTAMAQEVSDNRVSAETDWSVFVESNPAECWAVSAPKETLNTRDGNTVDVRRGDIRLIVFYRPSENVNGQVMFTGGYPFADGSTVSFQVGDTTFQMFTQGETAWPATAEDDAKFVAAMKRGANAVLTARSGRGTQTQDTFSLLGFTAAVDEAANRCAG